MKFPEVITLQMIGRVLFNLTYELSHRHVKQPSILPLILQAKIQEKYALANVRKTDLIDSLGNVLKKVPREASLYSRLSLKLCLAE